MPDWTYTITAGTSSASIWDDGSTYTYTPSDYTQQMWEEHQQECDRQGVIREQRWQEEAELREDKRKYPLFYWRELTDGNG